MNGSVTTTAVVTLTVTVRTGVSTWEPGCHIGQAYKEAESAAIAVLRACTANDRRVSVVAVDSVSILSEVRK